ADHGVRQNLGRVNLAITPRRAIVRGAASPSGLAQSRFEVDVDLAEKYSQQAAILGSRTP
ncbi:hypothetical protein, partial [Rhodopirellula sp. MGV]|uniref:hypothetical protein n=1 Tax=Rhodopirellula sp. MGV TaxID=2023130 RepID=UPI000BCA7A00